MRLNHTSLWKVRTNWISRELLLFNFERIDILCTWIGHPCDKLWPFGFLERFRSSISSVSIYNASESDIRAKSYDHLDFSTDSVVQFRGSRYIMCLNMTSVWNVMDIWISRELPLLNFESPDILCALIGHPCKKRWPFEFLESIRCTIWSVSMCYAPESDICVKSYDHLNFLRAFVAQFWVPQYVCTWIGQLCEKIWQLEFLDSFRCSITSA